MRKRVLDVGQCHPDHSTIRTFLESHFDCEVAKSHSLPDTLEQLQAGQFDLVLVNRKLDEDYSDGLEVIRAIKANPATAGVPVMMVTNYPDHQAAAVEVGALRGFGKLEFKQPDTMERLSAVLCDRA